ncbi:MAG: alkaline phosphatase family protein [Myxococcota bacterium]|jgi:predicted AlkP superfamily pyrophosphatase or phosphodiesterase|nr:alkaline phosphatase family protein [Myxococcota bacterium]
MPRTLTIFIDGVPFDQLEGMPFANQFRSRARLVPILGYSVNCQTMLFTGKTPDEIGFWCEWEYDPEASPFRRIKALLPLLGLADLWYPAKRMVHRVLDRLRWVSSTKNIPIPYLAMFNQTGNSVFDRGFDKESLLDHPEMTSFLHWHFANNHERDEVMFQAVLDKIKNEDDPGHITLMLAGIDHCSHWEGVASEPYNALLVDNDRYIRELTEAYLAKFPDGRVFVVSDHGMSNIEHHIALDLEARFGRPSTKRYAYFSEGTLLRVWSESGPLLTEISAYLDGIHGLQRFSDEDRAAQGITTRASGDLIYYTDDHHQLVPSFWGPKPSVGMHGHHPSNRSQHGICLSTGEHDFGEEVGAMEFYAALAESLES